MDPEHVTSIYQAAREDKSREYSFSYEYYPPKTPKGVTALYKRFWRMCQQKPLFADVTWGAGGSTSELTLDLTSNAKRMFGFEMNMHMTCTNMPKEKVEVGLREAKKNGIKNIMALRGDPPAGEEKWEALEGGFTCALDLIKYIKREYGDYFCISCAGYPEGHPLAITKVEEKDLATLSSAEKHRLVRDKDGYMVCRDKDYAKEIEYLKKKVDAGAQFIITQLFYDIEAYDTFVKTCRTAGIMVPIFPGIMPLTSYAGFKKMTGFCKTRITDELATSLEEIKDDKEAVKAFGLDYISNMCQKILDRGLSPHLHFYCLNKELAVNSIMERLGWPVKSKEELEGKAMNEAYAKVAELMDSKSTPATTSTTTTTSTTSTATTSATTSATTAKSTPVTTSTTTTTTTASTATTSATTAAKTAATAAPAATVEAAEGKSIAETKLTVTSEEAGTAVKKQRNE